MKLLVNSRNLNDTLKTVAKALPSRSVLPIIENFLWEIDGNWMDVSATNLENGISSKVAIEYKGDPIKVAVPGKIMMDILGALPEQPVTISIGEAFGIKISGNSGTYKVSGMSGEDFPSLPLGGTEKMDIPSDTLQRLLDKTIFAASTDADKAALNGIYLESKNGDFLAAATDAHRLQSYTANAGGLKNDFDMILPLRAAQILQGMIGNEQTVSFSFNDSQGFFTVGNTTLSCRLIDQKYPDYKNVIPTDNTKCLSVDKGGFISALKRVKIFANKATHQVSLSCKGRELILSCVDNDFQNEAREVMPCEYEGADIQIGFNAELLYESCLQSEGSIITIELSEPNRPALILPETQREGENLLGLVMPIMLNTYTQ